MLRLLLRARLGLEAARALFNVPRQELVDTQRHHVGGAEVLREGERAGGRKVRCGRRMRAAGTDLNQARRAESRERQTLRSRSGLQTAREATAAKGTAAARPAPARRARHRREGTASLRSAGATNAVSHVRGSLR